MHSFRETINLEWETPAQARNLPTAVLHGLKLTVAHSAGSIPIEGLRSAFTQALGDGPKERRVWRGVELHWGGSIPVRVRAKRNHIHVHALKRVTPKRLKRIVAALSNVPQAGRMRLQAHVRRFRVSDGDSVPME